MSNKMGVMRVPLVVANWKMHKTLMEAQAFVEAFLPQVEEIPIEVAIAPPFTALSTISMILRSSRSRVLLAAQNVHFAPSGAYTGEVSPQMLQDLGCRYVIVGHSERREHFGEDDPLINKKLIASLEHDLIPILCVGETLEERRIGATYRVLERQLVADLKGLTKEQASRLVIAYEPVWAISTGETASLEDAEQGACFIRRLIRGLYDEETSESLRVQYGGSVKSENAYELMALPDVDGLLVGGASLDPLAFARIVQAAAQAKH